MHCTCNWRISGKKLRSSHLGSTEKGRYKGEGMAVDREKLVRERRAGSRDFISKFLEILTTMARQTYYRG
jgi:hypothetical protein